jgi:DNA-binding transcriptional MerR regulator
VRISDLARITRVSPRMLRHYDEIGLFKPNLVLENGYREYSVSQIPILNRILALKDLGFSLEQLTELLREDFALDRLRELLTLKRAELEARVLEEQERLERVEARLRTIELEDDMTDFDVTVKTLPAQLVASVRNGSLEKRTPDGLRDIGAYFETMRAYLEKHGLDANSVPNTLLWHGQNVTDGPEAELVVPLEHPIPESDQVCVLEMPEIRAAATLEFRGRYDDEHMTGAFKALHHWVESNGYQTTGATRQVFLGGDGSGNPHRFLIELQVPIQRS